MRKFDNATILLAQEIGVAIGEDADDILNTLSDEDYKLRARLEYERMKEELSKLEVTMPSHYCRAYESTSPKEFGMSKLGYNKPHKRRK